MSYDPDKPAQTDEDIIAEAKRRYAICEDWEATARQRFIRDIKFGNGDSYNRYQWDDATAASRDIDKKPILTINKTNVHCLQIINDARQNKVAIEVRPTAGRATVDAAAVFEGLIRHIEYTSRATVAYEAALANAVYGGWGYCRVHVDYVDEDSFDQDIYIKRVADPLSIYLDPDIEEYDGSDARYGFVFKDTPRDEAMQKYPDYRDDFASAPIDGDNWNGKDYVRECEYFRVGEKSDELILLPDDLAQQLGAPPGTSVRKSELPKELAALIPKDARRRKITTPAIEWFLIVGNHIVDRKPWMGRYIPIARCIGQETVINGEMDRKGHVRCLLDAQKMYNFQASGSVEFVALQTKTPWLAPARAIEGLETYWETANTANHAVLPYNDMAEDGSAIAPPRRTEPPASAQGHLQGMQAAESQMMLASGQYQAVMGAPSNETSGKAINARQRQGDNATYHFVDHQAQMIAHIGRIVLDLIPKVYDTPRAMKILCPDETQMSVQIDPNAPDPHTAVQDPEKDEFDPEQVAVIFNPTLGKYEVMSDVGPSYESNRQEAFNAFSQIIQANASAFPVIADLWADNADFPGAPAMAKRFRNMVPQQALGGPSQQVQQMQHQMEQASQAALQHIDGLNQQIAMLKKKLDDQADDLQRESYEAETKRLAAIGNIDPMALKPIIRTMVSELLGGPAVPVMAAHMMADQQIASMAAQGGQMPQIGGGAPMPNGPMGGPQMPSQSAPQMPQQGAQ